MLPKSVTLTQAIPATPKEIYRSLTNASALREWFCDGATVQARAGGRFFLWWNDGYYSKGEYLALEPDCSVSFNWQGAGESTATPVVFTLTPEGEGTRVTVVHSGLEALPEADLAAFEKEWQRALEQLRMIFETGEDLRLTRRPMLGILLSDFSPEIAQNLGVPVTEGIRLDGVVEGMGAQKVGLEKDDVIISMNGKTIADFGAVGTALAGIVAGDEVEVIFYRGPEKHQVMMELSKRLISPAPATAAELGEALRVQQAAALVELDSALQGVSEEAASRKPAPAEWSAKEIIAHLIHNERDYQNYVAEVLRGFESQTDGFGGNSDARVAATVSVSPTLSDLVGELKRAMAENAAYISNLPPEFIRRKSSYWRIATSLPGLPSHVLSHLEQIKVVLR